MCRVYLFYLKEDALHDKKVDFYSWTDKKCSKDQFLKERDDIFYIKELELSSDEYDEFSSKNKDTKLRRIQFNDKLSILATAQDERQMFEETEYLLSEIEAIYDNLSNYYMKSKYMNALNYLCGVEDKLKVNYFSVYFSLFKRYIKREETK